MVENNVLDRDAVPREARLAAAGAGRAHDARLGASGGVDVGRVFDSRGFHGGFIVLAEEGWDKARLWTRAGCNLPSTMGQGHTGVLTSR
jgi:hypothetical protein